jgi:capsular polysaccharide biosynthesis protein
MWKAVAKFNRIRFVSENQKTGLVTLTMEWTDPQVSADWAMNLVAYANEEIRAKAIAEANERLEFLERALAETEVVEVRQVIYSLLEGQTKALMLANTRGEYAFKVLDPAFAPDHDDPTSPNKMLIIAAGLVLGILLGAILALLPLQNLARNQ